MTNPTDNLGETAVDLTPGEELYQAAERAMDSAFRRYTGTKTGDNMWNLDMEATWRVVAKSVTDLVYRAGREVTDREVRAAQAAAVRGAGDGIEEALRPSGGSLTGAQIAQMTRAIAASIESGHSNLGRSARGEEPNTERGSE